MARHSDPDDMTGPRRLPHAGVLPPRAYRGSASAAPRAPAAAWLRGPPCCRGEAVGCSPPAAAASAGACQHSAAGEVSSGSAASSRAASEAGGGLSLPFWVVSTIEACGTPALAMAAAVPGGTTPTCAVIVAMPPHSCYPAAKSNILGGVRGLLSTRASRYLHATLLT